jgi:hypothetical protein
MIELLGLAVLGVMIAEWFQPLQWIKNYFKLYNYKATSWLYCVKCCSFWLGLAVTFNLASAGVVCIFGYTISYLIDLMDKHRYGK